MSQFDIYENTGRNRKHIPFVLDVQSELLSGILGTTIVVPLYHAELIKNPALKIHIPVTIKRKKYIALFDELSSVMVDKLGNTVSNLKEKHENSFKTALDVLFFNYP